MARLSPVEGRTGFEPATFCCASSCTSARAPRPYRSLVEREQVFQYCLICSSYSGDPSL